MHQFRWLSKRRGNFFNLFQKEEGTQKGGVPSERGGGSNTGGNYDLCIYEATCSCSFVHSHFLCKNLNAVCADYLIISRDLFRIFFASCIKSRIQKIT